MLVLVMGSTGYLGTAVTEALVSKGHQVVAMVRPGTNATGAADVRVADLGDPEAVAAAVTSDIDAVVHAATPLGDWEIERRSIRAAKGRLAVGSRKFVYISGAWVLGSSVDHNGDTNAHTETSPVNPIPLVAGRERAERDVLEGDATGIVVRPGILHGRGRGIPALMTAWAESEGQGVFVGADDGVTWASVHVEDAADLVVLALERGESPQILHAVAESAVSVKAIATAADLAVGGTGRARRWEAKQAAAQIGAGFAEALALPQVVTSSLAQALGWAPSRPGILAEVRQGSYQQSAASA